MSDFFRIPRADLTSVGLTTLARMSHQAEDESDDVLLMNVAAEVESRGEVASEVFKHEYRRLADEAQEGKKWAQGQVTRRLNTNRQER